jgi:Omp85 superfamily domain
MPPSPQITSPAGLGVAGLSARFKSRERNAPIRESRMAIGLGTKYLNGIIGGFEQASGLGFGLELTTADKIPFVEFRLTALGTTRLYRRFEGEAYFPKIIDDKTHADVWFSYLRRTKDNFFGIGPNIPNTSRTNFDVERRSYQGSFYRDFTKHLQAGLYVGVTNSSSYPGERDTDIPFNVLFSGNPNVVPPTNFAPGFEMNTKILSYGLFAEYDLRNDDRGLTKGAYFYGRVGSNDGLKINDVRSGFGWSEVMIDASGYIPIFSDKTSLALRTYTELKNTKGGSQIPFYDLSYMGGRRYVRGFENYRFRANNIQAFSGEFRQTLWTQEADRGLDIFAFGDVGQVWGDNRSQTDSTIIQNNDFSSRNWKTGFGGGIQYRYSRAFSARVEAGASNERTLLYFSLTRGF